MLTACKMTVAVRLCVQQRLPCRNCHSGGLVQDVAILDVRGTVKTQLRSTNSQGCRLEMSDYIADYDTYLEGHIPGMTVHRLLLINIPCTFTACCQHPCVCQKLQHVALQYEAVLQLVCLRLAPLPCCT